MQHAKMVLLSFNFEGEFYVVSVAMHVDQGMCAFLCLSRNGSFCVHISDPRTATWYVFLIFVVFRGNDSA